MSVRHGREFLAIPGPHDGARRSAAGHAPPGDRHLFRRPRQADRQAAWPISSTSSAPTATSTSMPPTDTAPGRRRCATCCRAATRSWWRKAACSPSAGGNGPGAGRRGRGAAGRLAPGGRSGRRRGPAQGRHGRRDQGGARGADRHRLERRQRHPAIRRAIDAAGHDALYLVDTIASLATMPSRWTPGASTSRWRDRRRA
jgi:hypothetical protein